MAFPIISLDSYPLLKKVVDAFLDPNADVRVITTLINSLPDHLINAHFSIPDGQSEYFKTQFSGTLLNSKDLLLGDPENPKSVRDIINKFERVILSIKATDILKAHESCYQKHKD